MESHVKDMILLNGEDTERDDTIVHTLRQDTTITAEDANREVYSRIRPGDPATDATTRSFFQRLFFDPRARVTEGQPSELTQLRVGMGLEVRIVDDNARCFDGDRSAIGHRVACVGSEVHHDLANLSRVGPCKRRLVRQVELDPNIRRNQSPQDRFELADELIQVHGGRLEHLVAAEGEQLAGQTSGIPGRSRDVIDAVPERTRIRQLTSEQLCVPNDRRQHVVEIVRDAAG